MYELIKAIELLSKQNEAQEKVIKAQHEIICEMVNHLNVLDDVVVGILSFIRASYGDDDAKKILEECVENLADKVGNKDLN